MTAPPPPEADVVDLFLSLVAVPSPSGRERAVGELIQAWLAGHGIDAQFDGAGAVNGSDAGNLIAVVPGDAAAPRYLFVAHMDTVEAGSPAVAPVLAPDGVITSSGDTILGADNKSAVAAVMRVCAAAAPVPPPGRPTIVAAFTCREESGRMGASLLDLGPPVDCAFCVDGSKPIGTVITRALGQSVFQFAVTGRAAHAAANPEVGISAIRVAAEIIAALPLGRLPHGGSASVAAVVGGAVIDRIARHTDAPDIVAAALAATPTNSVPDRVLVRGEVRGYAVDDIDATLTVIRDIAQRTCSRHGAALSWNAERRRMVPPFPGAPGSLARRVVRAAAASVPGVAYVEEEAQATLEANYLAATTDVVAVASGGRNPHQITESITAAELRQLEALLRAIAGA